MKKTLRKWTFSSHSDQISKSNSMWHINYYQWVQIIDSEAKRFQKKMEKILVYQVLYINHTGNVDLLGLKFTLRIYLYELYFFRLNKESCTCTCIHIIKVHVDGWSFVSYSTIWLDLGLCMVYDGKWLK